MFTKRRAPPPAHAPERRAQLIALIHAGRTHEGLAREPEPWPQTIRN